MKSVVVGTAGHIDHGKSALVRALTGTDPDRLKEEQARGITIDLGFAHTTIGDLHVAFVDVPGHERFVKNMLAGAGGIDIVVLVVAADESVMPQTREHFEICRLLRVSGGVVAITKADLVDEPMLELVRSDIRSLTAKSFLESAPVVPVSSKSGEGLERFRATLADVAAAARRPANRGPARLPIDRVFSVKGFGTVVTGTLVSGRVRVDESLAIAPGDLRVKVRGLQVHGTGRTEATAGQRTAVNLAGVEVADVARGQQLVAPGAFRATRLADAAVEVIASSPPLKHGTRVRVHQGTAEVLARVSIVGPEAAPLQPGSHGFIRLRLEKPAVLARGDRYILRAYSPPVTIAGGDVLDPNPPRRAVRSDAARERLRRLDFGSSTPASSPDAELRALHVLIDESGAGGLAVAEFVSRAAITPGDLDARVEALERTGRGVRVGDVVVAPAVITRIEETILRILAEHHRADPLSPGVAREEARARSIGRGAAAVFDHAVDRLISAGSISGRERLALASHRLALNPEEERAREGIERLVLEAGLRAPDAQVIARDAHVPAAVADRVVHLLQRQKVLVRIDTLLYHQQTLTALKHEIKGLKAGGEAATIDVAAFKQRFGITRKFAIPLLEYLDRERITRRVGDQRVII